MIKDWLTKKALKFITNEAGVTSGTALSLDDINAFFNRGKSIYGPVGAEITYFTCLKTLSEGLGKMPIYLQARDKTTVLNHETYIPLNIQPNPIQTAAEWRTVMELCRNHFGNAFSFVARNPNGSLAGLYPLDPRCVVIWVDNKPGPGPEQFKYYYQYTETRTGFTWWIDPGDMLHIRSWITEKYNLKGRPVRDILYEYLLGRQAAQSFLNDLYQNGMQSNVAVKYVGDLGEAEKKQIIQDMKNLSGVGTDRVMMVPFGWDVVNLDLKLVDSQFSELRKMSALEIAAAFGVKPNHLNNYEKNSYNNSSMQNLSFYVDTLLYNSTLYEQELRRKLLTRAEQQAGLEFKFDINVILRGDPSEQAEVLTKLVTGGIRTPNEARFILDDVANQYGDDLIVQAGVQRLKDLDAAAKPQKGAP